jgi:glycosyltransferase involved in cell wall biosynthesis
MRILVLTHNYPRFPGDPAGAFVGRLARAAAQAGHGVRIVAPHAAGTATAQREGALELRRFRYAPEWLERVGYRGDLHARSILSPLIGLGVPALMTAFALAARRAVREFQPHIVHAHWWLPAGWLASLGSVPYVVTCHGSDVRLLHRGGVLRRIARPVFAKAGRITCVSRFLARDLTGVFPPLASKIVVAPMPIDVATFEAAAPMARAHPPRILYAGNLIASKGVDVLLDAFASVRRQGIACTLRIVGEGPALPSLRERAAALGIAHEVTWSPFVPQDAMPAEYGASTVCVLPTRGQAEGLGLTLVEALLAGCAVVGTPAGGIPDVIRHDVTGLLARDGDAADLAAQLSRLLGDPALRQRLVSAGREYARRTYDPATCAAHFLKIYRSVDEHRDAA